MCQTPAPHNPPASPGSHRVQLGGGSKCPKSVSSQRHADLHKGHHGFAPAAAHHYAGRCPRNTVGLRVCRLCSTRNAPLSAFICVELWFLAMALAPASPAIVPIWNGLSRFGVAPRGPASRRHRELLSAARLSTCFCAITNWLIACNTAERGRASNDPNRRWPGRKGPAPSRVRIVAHLPLRGKLGWMTPRLGSA
jgi:hypothetical protein